MNHASGMPKTFLDHCVDGQLRLFFDRLFKSCNIERFGPEVVNHLGEYALRKEDFPQVSGTYSRTIITRTDHGFEAMAARWSRGIETAVHGHPDYAFYQLVEGKVGVENFVRTKTGLECTGKQLLSPGDYLCMTGVQKTFDNAIHRISALQESLSVHVYSDDALKGACFPDYPVPSPFFVEAHSIETNLSTC
jgi:hypothetical protein